MVPPSAVTRSGRWRPDPGPQAGGLVLKKGSNTRPASSGGDARRVVGDFYRRRAVAAGARRHGDLGPFRVGVIGQGLQRVDEQIQKELPERASSAVTNGTGS
jgi:hypothetical protein